MLAASTTFSISTVARLEVILGNIKINAYKVVPTRRKMELTHFAQ